MCQQADAQRAIRKQTDSGEQELYVCQSCADATESKPKPQVEAEKLEEVEVSILGGGDDLPKEVMDAIKSTLPGLLDLFMNATLEISGHAPKQAKRLVCPQCKMTHAEHKKTARLGCEKCYQTFARDLTRLIHEMHRSPHHSGKRPNPHVAPEEKSKS